MSRSEKTGQEREWRGTSEEQAVRGLLHRAGPRVPFSAEELTAIATIGAAGRATWRERYRERDDRRDRRERAVALRRWRRSWISLAAAAALLAGVGLAWWVRRSQPPAPAPQAMATVELLTGAVRLWDPGSASPVELSPALLGHVLRVGATLETAAEGDGRTPGRLALRTPAGTSLRLDAGSRLRFAAASAIELVRGGVYVDSGAVPDEARRIAVHTPSGIFEELGTQFEVRVVEGAVEPITRLRVREGRVFLARQEGAVTTEAGTELDVLAGGRLVQRPLAVSGPEWGWILATAPMLDIEGVKVRVFLDWIARETGWLVETADQQAAAIVDSVELHGSIGHLSLAEAPRVVLASCGLGYQLSDGRMQVFVAGSS